MDGKEAEFELGLGLWIIGTPVANRARVCINPRTKTPTVQVIHEFSCGDFLVKVIRYCDPEIDPEVCIENSEVTKFPKLEIMKPLQYRLNPEDRFEILS